MACTPLFEDDFESGDPITTNYATPWTGSAAETTNGIGVGGGWAIHWAGGGSASHVDFSLKHTLFPQFTPNADGSVDFCFHADYKPDPAFTSSDGYAMFELEQHHWNPASSVLFPILSVVWTASGNDLELFDKDFNSLDYATGAVVRDGTFRELRVEGRTSMFTAGFGNADGYVSVYWDDVLVLSATGADFWVFDPNGGLGSEDRFGFTSEPSGIIDNIVLGATPIVTPPDDPTPNPTQGTIGPYAFMDWPIEQP